MKLEQKTETEIKGKNYFSFCDTLIRYTILSDATIQLEILSGKNKNEKFVFDFDRENNSLILGRAHCNKKNSVALKGEGISRIQTTIRYKNNKFYISDDISANGTWLMISETTLLKENMILQIGSTMFKVNFSSYKEQEFENINNQNN